MTELAEAAASGLDEFTRSEQQAPLVPVVKVKFNGLQYDSMDSLPALKESLKFEIEGFVVGHGQTVLANGEIQDMAQVKVTNVTPVQS